MNKKEQILKDFEEGETQAELAKKYSVDPSYVSRIIKQKEIQEKLERLEYIKSLFERGVVILDDDKLTEKDKKKLDEI